jgi:hypothetical protein
VLASLVPLTLLGLGLLGATGREDLWRSDLGPAVQERVTLPVYSGIDYTVERYKSAVAALFVFLLLTTYVLASTTIFLVGAQVDELARKGARR